ncbi:MAG: SDR family oxidoreductase [Proteobacteria bacterium]|nr:SDR family oxidoreductase [Pseudomonadota bacterium]
MRIIFGGNSDIGQAIEGFHVSRGMCDVSDLSQVKGFTGDEIVNCAGVINGDYEEEIRVNLIGSFNIAKLLTNGTKCVFIGSTSGLRGRAGWSGYCASKAGVISLVQSLAEEGYQVWCVSPGRTRTKMRKDLFPDEDQNTLMEPSEVAKVVEDCFLGKYPTGANIIVRKDSIEVQN